MFDVLSALWPSRRPSLSVPVLDGALKPDNRLEKAEVVAEAPGLEDLATGPGGALYAALGPSIVEVAHDGSLKPVARFESPVSAITFMPDGTLAVGLGDRVVLDALGAKAPILTTLDGKALGAVTALCVGPGGSLLICDGSVGRPYAEWSRDLLDAGRTGRLIGYAPATGTARTLVGGLAYAFGAMTDAQGRILVSESWKHQVCTVRDGRATPLISQLPGYPARFAPAAGGGFWLTIFACRTQLVEFVLRETDYRREMMRTIAPDYWVAPALRSGVDFLEPLQGGGVKQMGVLKPWAPSRSYGLVVRYAADGEPLFSLHSRAGGRHHGVMAAAERGDDLFVLSKGAGRILRLPVETLTPSGAPELTP